MADQRVTMTVCDGVADVRLNRPDKLNALDEPMFAAIAATIGELAERRDVRCVVLSGEGRAFCVGIDLERIGESEALRDLMPRLHGDANLFQQAAWGWRTLPVPVIAAVHGFAFGGGCQIMLGADLRIVAPDAQLSVMEMRWGLVPDMGGIALARGLIREDHWRDLVFTARKVGGSEAVGLGLATRTAADPRAAALAQAQMIAAASPDALRAAKRLINQAPDLTAAELLLAESREQQALMAAPNHREALSAGQQGRAPVYRD